MLGAVDRVTVFPHHPGGVAMVKFASAGAAVEALSVFNGRYFGGRRVVAEFWDGKERFECVPRWQGGMGGRGVGVDPSASRSSLLGGAAEPHGVKQPWRSPPLGGPLSRRQRRLPAHLSAPQGQGGGAGRRRGEAHRRLWPVAGGGGRVVKALAATPARGCQLPVEQAYWPPLPVGW